MIMNQIQRYAKFIVAILTVAVGAAVDLALPIPEDVIGYVRFGIAVLGAVAVYGVPNATPDADYDEGAINPDTTDSEG
jgi:hypothetical protein